MKPRSLKVTLSAACVAAPVIAMCALGSTAAADNIYNNGNSTSLWQDNGNWSSGAYPTGTGAAPYTSNIDISTAAGSPASSVVQLGTTGVNYTLVTQSLLTVGSGETVQDTPHATQYLLFGYVNSTTATEALNNAGTIDQATQGFQNSYMYLVLAASTGVTQSVNTGTIESTAGILVLDQNPLLATLNNTGGTIETQKTGATIPSLYFGGITTYPSGVSNGTTTANQGIAISGGSVINGAGGVMSTNANATGRVSISNAALTNNGTLSVNPAAANTTSDSYLQVQSGTTFNNSGTTTIDYAGTSAGSGSYADLIVGNSSPTVTTDSGTNLANTGTITIENTGLATSGLFAGRLELNTSGGTLNNDGTISFASESTTAGVGVTQLLIAQNESIGNSGGNHGSIIFNDSPNNYVDIWSGASGTPVLTIGSGQTLSGAVHLGNGNIGITNSGTINANGTNPIVISTSGNSFTNNGTLHVSGSGGATISDASFSNAGTLQVDAGRTLTDNGNLAFSAGNYTVQIISSGTPSIGLIDITGFNTLNLGSGLASLNVTDSGGVTLPLSELFTIMESHGDTGYFSNLPNTGSTITAGANTFEIVYNSDSVQLETVSPVPEPASASALLALGSLGLLQRRRRARRTA